MWGKTGGRGGRDARPAGDDTRLDFIDGNKLLMREMRIAIILSLFIKVTLNGYLTNLSDDSNGCNDFFPFGVLKRLFLVLTPHFGCSHLHILMPTPNFGDPMFDTFCFKPIFHHNRAGLSGL